MPMHAANRVLSVPNERNSLRGIPLYLMRGSLALIILLTLGVVIFSIPINLGKLANIPLEERNILLNTWNLDIQFYIWFMVILDLLTIFGFCIPAIIIFISKSDDWMTALVSLALITFGAGITTTLENLQLVLPAWHLPVTIIRSVGISSTLLVFYLFPNGRFIPLWTRYLAWVWLVWLGAWVLLPANPVSLEAAHPIVRYLVYLVLQTPESYNRIYIGLRLYSLLLVLFIWFGSGVVAQNIRYKHHSTQAEQRQTKWTVLGFTVAFSGALLFYLLPTLIPALRLPGIGNLLFDLIGGAIYRYALISVPLSFAISVSIFRLWDVDYLINRTLVYGMLTTFLGISFILYIILFQYIFGSLTQFESSAIIVISTLALMFILRPFYQRVQKFVDRRFYRERIDFRQAFTGFSKQVRTIIDLPELLHVLVERTTQYLHATYGAVFLFQQNGTLGLVEALDIDLSEGASLSLDPSEWQQILRGIPIHRHAHPTFPMLVPLISPQPLNQPDAEQGVLLGVLALGPQRSGLSYSRENRDLLMGLADQAGTAIYVARLMEEKQAEALRREEAERSLEEHRNSPLGQAELRSQALREQPANALAELHHTSQEAGSNPLAASLLANLPTTLNNLGEAGLAGLAEGFNFMYLSQFTPELLEVGLRGIIAHLVGPQASHWQEAEPALSIYQRCHMALEANSISQLLALEETWNVELSSPTLAELSALLQEFRSVLTILHAYERVESAQDRLAYLASAVERLRHLERTARADLGSADRPLILAIAESWLSVVTGTISELQARSRLICQLLTRHTWQVDVVSLSLNIRNEGRGAALNIRVSLAPDSAYTLLDGSANLECIGYGEEAQVILRVRPHLEKGADHFRARFVILYTDPRGPDQVENFADVVRLLTTGAEFQFIPNPYVVGTPLQTGSPLFFGRADIIAYVQENLAASHRNNLVLIGQRRTGKTSLLKQLPGCLSDDYLPVYLDGQALGLDPGMPNFFLTLATEMAFALEDRGFQIDSPELEAFQSSPAATFERNFIGQVREAIGNRHLLLMLDEFEELETAVRRGDLEPSIFGFLRHLIQHTPNLSVIFCGTHRLEELASDYWSVLFNISIYRHISFLSQPEALRLVQEPVEPYGMRYDDLALDKIWRITAGHPYFLQLLCHSLVNQHNKTQRSYATVADVNAALEEILASGEAHFVYLWAESSPLERLMLTAMSRLIPLSGQIAPVQILDYLTDRGVSVERKSISDALHRLALRDVLSVSDTGAEPDTLSEAYRWKLGLLGMWVEKYKSISRVIDEVS
ncbi:MAG: hypothetical protein JW726_11700 [Anaerolineales bacterium]|nr:hypothetical protein [Anaerolineales bacterium]